MALWHGLLAGLGMMIFIGPVFFYLLQTSLQYGTKSGLTAAFGIFTSDILAVVVCYQWASVLFEGGENKFWLSIIGGFILVIFGLGYIFKPSIPKDVDIHHVSKGKYASFFTKAFLINIVNPFVFGVWTAIIGLAEKDFGQTNQVKIFMAAALFGVVFTDSLKVLGAKYLRKFIEPTFLRKLYLVIGLLLIAFSIRLFVFAAQTAL
ncbi:MAG: LysE family transporter [Flavobacteriales bacterium]|nr:LysE family transporter [Flavobacteriales bacterium]